MGDLIHSLVAPACVYNQYNWKTNFYIAEAFDKFETSLQRSIEELQPILAYQKYINSFEKFRNGIHEIDVDLNMFRLTDIANYHANYTFLSLLKGLGTIQIPFNFKYLDAPVLDEYKDYLIISRKPGRTEWNDFVEMQYKHIMSKFEKKLFISFNGKDYEKFPLKNDVDLLVVEELFDFVKIVNSGSLFLTNCSGPLCFASALNVNRVAETGSWIAGRYKGDNQFSDKSEIFNDNGTIYTKNTKYLLKANWWKELW